MRDREMRRRAGVSRIRVTMAATGAAVLAAATLGAASSGSGTFRFDKVTTKFAAACGFRIPDPLEAGKFETAVFLTEAPIDCAKADAGFDPVAGAKAQLTKSHAWFLFRLTAAGDRADGEWSSPKNDDGSPFGVGGQGKLALTTNTTTRVEGRWNTPKPEAFFKQTFEFDVRFAVDVLSGAITGTALPKGGGEPGKVFQAYTKAVGASDKKTLQSVMTTAAFEEKAPMLSVSKDFDLKTATIAGGLQKGDLAVLEVEGVSHDNSKMRGRAHLVREAGAWKVREVALRMIF